MRQYIINTFTGGAAALIASAAARALPQPVENGSRLYLWFYRFAHFILANFDKTQIANSNSLKRYAWSPTFVRPDSGPSDGATPPASVRGCASPKTRRRLSCGTISGRSSPVFPP
jgi:hypothetical protein